MATMNHINLTTYNVPALTESFCSVFGFRLIEKRADKLSVLQNGEGFLLTLHDDLSTRNYMAPKPAKLQRGGPPTYGFYYDAPGGVMVEVSYDEHCRTLLNRIPKRVRIYILTRRGDRRVCAIWHSSGGPPVHILRPIFEGRWKASNGATEHIEDGQ